MTEQLSTSKTIWEPAREVRVFTEAEVVVVGGGPGGRIGGYRCCS